MAGFIAPPVTLALGPQAPFIIGVTLALGLALLLQPLRTNWDADRDPGHSLKRNPIAEMVIM